MAVRVAVLTILVLVAGWRVQSAGGEVTGAFIMPHGGIALDPSHFNTSNATALQEAWQLHHACQSVGAEIAKLQPDLVLLSTPHGVADLTRFLFYLNPRGFGWADTDNCGCPPCCYNVSVAIDANRSVGIVQSLQSLGANVSGLTAYGPPATQGTEPFPLRWGEVIPLHFLSPLPAHTRVLLLSQPSRRYTEDVAMIPELLKLGSQLHGLLEPLREKVVVVVSGDMAHTHLSSGPYGYSNASEPFDLAVGRWAGSLDPTPLLETAAGLVDRALSCGYTGFVMLHGLLEAAGLKLWLPKVFANYHPSYYGMMVAQFLRNSA